MPRIEFRTTPAYLAQKEPNAGARSGGGEIEEEEKEVDPGMTPPANRGYPAPEEGKVPPMPPVGRAIKKGSFQKKTYKA